MLLSLRAGTVSTAAAEDEERPDSNEDVGDAADAVAAAESVGADILICFDLSVRLVVECLF